MARILTYPLPSDAPLIPLVLGVVGHRDLSRDDNTKTNLQKALTQVFNEFDNAYPNSPKILLSPLSAGADQVAADVALNRGHDWTVRVPLPFEPKLTMQSTSFQFAHLKSAENPHGTDFAARDHFETLLYHDRVEWFIVPRPSEISVAGREVVCRGKTWFWSPSQPGEKEEPVDWEAVVVGTRPEFHGFEELRRACYANAGVYVVRHCHTLIALWDEQVAKKPSGTAEIVRFQLGGIPPTHYPSTADAPLGFDSERGPVIVIHAPQGNATGDAHRSVFVPSRIDGVYYGEQLDLPQVARTLTLWERFRTRAKQTFRKQSHEDPLPPEADVGAGPLRPEPLRTKSPEYDQFLSICQTIDDFNREVVNWYGVEHRAPNYQKRLDKAEGDFQVGFPASDPEDGTDCQPNVRTWYRRLLRVRETAAHLANNLSPGHERAGKWLFGLLFFAVCVFHLYAHPVTHFDDSKPMEHWPPFLVLYGGLWLVMMGLVAWLWWIRLDDRRHDYRALAEALRVRQAYALAGSGRSVADTYLSQLRSELAWVRLALLHLCPPPDFWKDHFVRLPASRKLERMRQVEKIWVKDQRMQHKTRMKEEHDKAFKLRRQGYLLALAGLVILAVVPWGGTAWDWAAGIFQPAALADTAKGTGHQAESTKHSDSARAGKRPNGDPSPDPAISSAHDASFLGHWLHPSRPLNFLLFLGSMATILGGLLIAVCEKRAHEELARQYDRMYVVFRSGARELEIVLDPKKRELLKTGSSTAAGPPAAIPPDEVDFDHACRIVEELGRESLQENAQWLVLRRSKPLELPLGA
jgi:hypothetical protein